jgi:quercetin dioxygenase-like cupin family protein
MPSAVSYLVLRKKQVLADWRVHVPRPKDNNGRKVLVIGIFPATERPADDPDWKAEPRDGHTPVVETGPGGVEVGSFTHEAGQDCHLHLIGTEIYTVLQGQMWIRLNRNATVGLRQGDEIVVLPGTPHEVLRKRSEFLTRVHTVNCYGEQDKYVRYKGKWCLKETVRTLTEECGARRKAQQRPGACASARRLRGLP